MHELVPSQTVTDPEGKEKICIYIVLLAASGQAKEAFGNDVLLKHGHYRNVENH